MPINFISKFPREFRTSGLRHLRGVSLVEFMVALTIGMVLTLGILILMSSVSRSYKISDEFARMQESGSSGIRYIGDDIRMAGFYGMAADTTSINTYNTALPDAFIDYGQDAAINFGLAAGVDCNAATPNWSLQTSDAEAVNYPAGTVGSIGGLPPGTTAAAAHAALPCIAAANFVPGQAIILRGALGNMINRNPALAFPANTQPQNWTAAQLDANTLYVQADPGNGFVFLGANYDLYKNANYARQIPAGAGLVVDAPIYPFQAHIYYIRPCSRPTGAVDAWNNPTCQATDDQNRPIPTLARQEWQSTAGGPVLREVGLVEGVEQMSVFYGLDSLSAAGLPVRCTMPGKCDPNSPDGLADTFTATPTVLQWSQVVMVRINFLVRASAPTPGYDDSAKTYDLGGGVTWNCTAVAGSCNYKRHMFSQQIQLRNVAGRRNG